MGKTTELSTSGTPESGGAGASGIVSRQGEETVKIFTDAQIQSLREALTVDPICDFPDFVAAVLALLDEREVLRRKLFPYADANEISGISWDGKYLIGDKNSITYFREMQNRGEQIDVYKRAYDERIAAAEADVARMRKALEAARTSMRAAYPRRSPPPRRAVMLAKWTRILPYFIVAWLTKRYAERFDIVPGFHSATPYGSEVLSWRAEKGGDR